MEEKRTVHSPLINFLKNVNKDSDFDKYLDTTLINFQLMALILRFAKGPEKKFYVTRSR